MASRVTSPTTKGEGAKEEGTAKATGSVVSTCRPLRLKLGLAPLDRTNTYGTHDGEESRERNGNVKVLKDPCDSLRKDELITSSGILIHIHDRCDEVRGKVSGKILHQGKKKTSMRLNDGVIVRQRSESECHHHVKESWAFGKA